MVCVWVQIAPNLFNWKSSNCRIRTSSVIGEILSPRYPNGVSDHHHRRHYHYNAYNFNNTWGSDKVWILSQSGAGGALTESQVFIKKRQKDRNFEPLHAMRKIDLFFENLRNTIYYRDREIWFPDFREITQPLPVGEAIVIQGMGRSPNSMDSGSALSNLISNRSKSGRKKSKNKDKSKNGRHLPFT